MFLRDRRPMTSGMTLEEFLGDKSRGGGGGKSKYLRGWERSPPFSVTVWLSMQAQIYKIWRHNFKKLEPRETEVNGQKVKTLEIWSNKLVCYEHNDVLKVQHFRDKATREREVPPEICPHCIMMEDVYQRVLIGNEVEEKFEPSGRTAPLIALVADDAKYARFLEQVHAAGGLHWLEPLFRFDGQDSKTRLPKTEFIHAGGLFNAFGSKNLTADDKAAMAAVPASRGGPIYAKTAWTENNNAKCEYVFIVADAAHPEEGLQVAVQGQSLGEKMQKEIAKQCVRFGSAEKGSPILNPYPFKWDVNPAETISFNEKYDVTALDGSQMTPAIMKLIRDTPPPDVSSLIEKFNARSHRASLERYAVVQLPWDSYFKKLDGAQAAAAEVRVPEVGNRPAVPAPLVPAQPAVAPAVVPPPAQVTAPSAEPAIFGCDGCGAPMKPTDSVCAGCGMRYEVQAEPPKPSLPKRSTAIAQVAAPKDTGTNASVAAAVAPLPPRAAGSLGPLTPEHEPLMGDPSDDLPF
jgi:hypothetical protein